jgi:hypothetical protein
MGVVQESQAYQQGNGLFGLAREAFLRFYNTIFNAM